MKEAGFDVASLNLPENPSDVYYRAQYRVAMSGTELSQDEIQKLMDEVDLGWKKIRNHAD